MRWLLATRNRNKVGELKSILEEAGLADEVLDLDDVHVPDTPETGLTFEDNALIKARAAALSSGLPTMADDSGLAVDALSGMPGVFSARWAGGHGDDAANLDLVLAQISDVADTQRGARFVCAAAAVWPVTAPIPADVGEQGPLGREWREAVVRGELLGRLAREPRGSNGFGYDPIFEVEQDGRVLTTAEMPAEDKNAISHRSRAFRGLVEYLRERP